jgi:parallel beta-helix repeat protein
LNNEERGTLLDKSNNNTITNNNVLGNQYGFQLSGSNNNTLSNNTISGGFKGTLLLASSNNAIINNTINLNDYFGIELGYYSSNNTILNNTISNNEYGIYLYYYSNNNKILHNNFVDNPIQAYDGGTNTWHGGYPVGGNYWSDFDTQKEGCVDTNFDNVCDHIYFKDNYPVVETEGWLNITPDIIPPVIIIHSPQNVTYTTTTIDLKTSANETIRRWWYSLNNADNVTFAPNTTIEAREGQNNIIVYANDSVGNINSTTVYFTVYKPPLITITSPENITYTSDEETKLMDLNVTADEPIDTWWYSLNNASNVTFTPNTTIEAIEGPNNIIVYANDSAGYLGSATVYFTLLRIWSIYDADGDGTLNVDDACPLIRGKQEFRGCPYGILTRTSKHTLPGPPKREPLIVDILIFTKMQIEQAGISPINWKTYDQIIQLEPITNCTTEDPGVYNGTPYAECMVGVEKPDDYLVIGVYDGKTDKQLGATVDANDTEWQDPGYVTKNLRLFVEEEPSFAARLIQIYRLLLAKLLMFS